MQFVKNAIIIYLFELFFCFMDGSGEAFVVEILNADSANEAEICGFYKIYPFRSAGSAESAFKNLIFK